MKTILIAGGAGYIGSHTAVHLLQQGYQVVIVDNLSNAQPGVVAAIEKVSGKQVIFYHTDVRQEDKLAAIFAAHPVWAVMHFAALKAVAQSVADPLAYYDNNVGSTISLCRVMDAAGVHRLVYSSSATVYGLAEKMPLTEEDPVNSAEATNPYGRSKIICEGLLQDLSMSNPAWSIALLRYFNPIGAHPSGMLGEFPLGVPRNIMPLITQVALGTREIFHVTGNDYPTPDGTCLRDYIHISDLVAGHTAALDFLATNTGCHPFNLGNGKGYSVLQVLKAFEEATGIPIPYAFAPRRPGDVPVSYADCRKANTVLGWQATLEIVDMCRDAWRWQQNNPEGYGKVNISSVT
ncbi:MAG: UDP-glucose 4-epimerase GalE [Symbiobacteriaceae bacterium]|nr:UDP-glucose 4-epimerase GalE [Symbiobacteriaceae bacterium]